MAGARVRLRGHGRLEVRGRRFHRRRRAELERPERGIEDVAPHVAERAGPEVLPRAPLHRVIGGMDGRNATGPSHRSQSSVFGHRRRVLRPGPDLEVGPRIAAHRAVGPRVDLGHVADRAGVEPLLQQPHRLVGLALVAHLRDDLVLARRLGDGARLVHGVGQRLLAVHVLAGPHHGHRDRGVRVVRRRDDHAVDALLLLEHLAGNRR